MNKLCLLGTLCVLVLSSFTYNTVSAASLEADGFNFPIGPRNPGTVTEDRFDEDGWGAFPVGGDYTNEAGVTFTGHSGVDWNDSCGDPSDLGAPVYAIARGTVIDSKARGEEGDIVVIEHSFAGETYYSLYLHVDSMVAKGNGVERDQVIGRLANTKFATHLHFELRTLPIVIYDPVTDKLVNPWPNDIGDGSDRNGYYGDSYDAQGTLITSSEKLALDGIMEDPSGFIAAHRPPSTALERGTIPSTFTFEHYLEDYLGPGDCRYDIRYLQTLLNLDPDTRVALNDEPGSLGFETSKLGNATKNALMKFQNKYLGPESSTGNLDVDTRSELNRVLTESRVNPRVDVALIIDSSGSMTWNDPDDARLDAARAYLTGSFAGDFVGVVDFDGSARLASELLELPDNKDSLIDAIETIDSSGGTNIGIGIQEGCDALLASPSLHNLTKGAILLTDGVGGSIDQKECFEKRRWPIYTFGLGSGVNDAELETIALDTGGEYTQLPANSLICEFQKVRAKIAGAEEPPPCESFVIFQSEFTTFFVEVEPGQLQITFSVDWLGSDIITKLITPSGRVIDMNTVASDITHDKGATFEVFAITNPEAGTWEVELFGADIPEGGEDATFGFVSVPAPVTVVSIDIMPNSDSNPVNSALKGVIPVAILTTSTADGDFLDFDALEVDPLTVSFGSGGAIEAHSYGHAEDVDGDGDIDLIFHFSAQETGVMCSDTNMTMTGETFGGQVIEATDSVRIIKCK